MTSPEFTENPETTETDPSLATSEGSEQSDTSGINEAWKPLLDVLPEQYQQMESVREPLKKWDQNYQALQEKYEPFKDYDPEMVQQSMTLLQNLNNDPHHVLKLLAENLGVSLAEAKEIVEEQKQEEPEIEFTDDDDPRLVAMAKQLKEYEDRQQQFFETQTQREQERLVQEQAAIEGQKIDQQVKAILDQGHFGTTEQEQKPFLQVLMPLANSFMAQGSRDPIADAWKQMQGMMGVVQQRATPQPQKQNYLFLPANAGAPPATNQEGPDLNSESGRRAFAKQIAEQALRG